MSTSDLIELLSAIVTFSAEHDLDGDGGVATSDLMAFLGTYGQVSDC